MANMPSAWKDWARPRKEFVLDILRSPSRRMSFRVASFLLRFAIYIAAEPDWLETIGSQDFDVAHMRQLVVELRKTWGQDDAARAQSTRCFDQRQHPSGGSTPS